MALTQDQLKAFSEKGVLKLKNRVSDKEVRTAKRAVESELERLKLKTGGKISAGKIKDLPIFQQTGQLGQMVKIESELIPLFSGEVIDAVSALAGQKILAAPIRPQLLLSLPHKEDWSLENLNWHLDLAVPKQDVVPGIQAFILIDEVKPKGGATLAIAGSHKLHYQKEAQGNAHNLIKYKDISQFEIVEMCGRAGEVYLMDMRVLHSPSINATKNIRMMATVRFPLKS